MTDEYLSEDGNFKLIVGEYRAEAWEYDHDHRDMEVWTLAGIYTRVDEAGAA